ncbi:MAG: hypothetical protein RLZZ200_1119 [Pseudomonadota bacterium]|jgi:parallel beta-helix repeat protein
MSTISIVPPYSTFAGRDGEPLEAGFIYIGEAGLNPLIEANRVALFSDPGLLVPVAQPVRTIGGFPVTSGTPVRLYAAESDYAIALLDRNSTLVYSSLYNKLRLGLIDSTDIEYDITEAEALSGVTIVNLYYEPGNVLRYGTNTTPGTTDMRVAFQAAMTSSESVYVPSGTYYLSGSVSPLGNSLIRGAGRSSHVIVKDGDAIGFDLTGLTGVEVRDLKFSCNGAVGTLGGINGKSPVYLYNSAQCTVENCFFFNVYNVGIRLYDSSNNKIRNNWFGDWYTTSTPNEDSANIFLMGGCSYNIIEGNFCIGSGAGTGIVVHDYYLVGKQPIGNIINANRVDNKKAYGILVYTTGVGTPNGFDCKTVVSNNTVSNILGDFILGASGAGIYLQGGGGAVCVGNTVYNCCVNTTNFGTLAMAHITASITNGPDTAQILVANNHVHSLRGPGIWAASSTYLGLKVTGNTIRCDQLAGGDANAIVLSNSDFSDVTNNAIKQLFGTAIYVTTTGPGPGYNKNINVSGNTIDTLGIGIVFTKIGAGSFRDVIVTNNSLSTGDSGMNFADVAGMQLSNNNVRSVLYPISVNGCTYVKASANKFEATNGAGFHVFGGVCTGMIVDETNAFIGGTGVQNSSTAAVISQYGNTAPAIGGTWAVGDRVIRLTPVVGQPKGWRCTVAGAPGTWVSEGNL